MEPDIVRQELHDLLDRLGDADVIAARELLRPLSSAISRALANAPTDDEPEPREERRAVQASQDWFKNNPEGIPFEQVVSELGLTMDDVRNHQKTP